MPSRNTLAAAVVCFGLIGGVRPASAEVTVTINAGRVSVSAKNATIGQILAEWAKVGQTKIVNGERVSGGPMTIELTNVPEGDAIEILLRSAGGYVLAPRHAEAANLSRYDRILILPPSSNAGTTAAGPNATRVAATVPPARPGQRVFPPQPGQIGVQSAPQSDDNDDPAERPTVINPAPPGARAPVFNTFPQPAQQRTDPPAATTPTSSVTAPVGVAVPGMIVPIPQQQPGQQGQPGVIAPPQQDQR